MVSEMAKGKTLDEAMKITNKSVVEALDGLPKKKHHCSNLGADALHRAIEDYRAKHKGKQYQKSQDSPEVCECPVCDVTDPEEVPYCSQVCEHSER
jgi:nitrogen fixation protein NifU and related proteins